jgi:hypothetical protein
MEIKIHKSHLFSNISSIEKYLHLDFIDTKLLVGKSYSSRGLQLSKEVVSQLFPSGEYAGDYLIYIVAIVFLSSGSGDMSLMSFEWAFVPSILPVVASIDYYSRRKGSDWCPIRLSIGHQYIVA